MPIADPPRRGGDLLAPRTELRSLGYCYDKALTFKGWLASPRVGDGHGFARKVQRFLLPGPAL